MAFDDELSVFTLHQQRHVQRIIVDDIVDPRFADGKTTQNTANDGEHDARIPQGIFQRIAIDDDGLWIADHGYLQMMQ